MLLAATPPAELNTPPAISSELYSTNAKTEPLTPPASGFHDVPFQRAMLLAGIPPAEKNAPPAINSPSVLPRDGECRDNEPSDDETGSSPSSVEQPLHDALQ